MDWPAILTAAVGFLAPLGAGIAYVWNKVEARFKELEAKVAAYEIKDKENSQRRVVHLTVIRVLLDEVERIAPDSKVLARAKQLLDSTEQFLSDNATVK